jgi:hypothetical protein
VFACERPGLAIADKSSCEQGTCGFENTHPEIRAARPLKLFPRGGGRRTVLIETSVHQFFGDGPTMPASATLHVVRKN